MKTEDIFKYMDSFSESPVRYARARIDLGQVFSAYRGNVDLWMRFYLESFRELALIRSGGIMRVSAFRRWFYFKMENLIGEDSMNEFVNNAALSVDVSIGNLSMTISDLLAIEKGDCIVSKLPSSRQVNLMIAGETIATASFELEGGEILLKINETFLGNNTVESDNTKAIQN